RGRAASDQASTALEAQQRAIEGFRPDMLEDDIDAFLARNLAHGTLETVASIVDDVVCTQRFCFFRFAGVADRGDHRAVDSLRHYDGSCPDARAARMHEHGLARLELCVVEQHVLNGGKADRCASSVAQRHPRGDRNYQPRRHVDEVAREAIDMETHDAGNILAEIVTSLPASLARAAGQGAVHDHRIPGREACRIRADSGDFTRGLHSHDDGELALGESHAAVSPQIEVIERYRLDPDLYLRGRGRRRR